MIYCPYTNRDLDESQANSEHIIPLSLGGVNGFEIPVCKEFNSRAGSEIDAKIGKELVVQSRRVNLKVKGHSSKTPEMYYKNALDVDTGIPMQVKISKDKGISARVPHIPKGAKHPTGRKIQLTSMADLDVWLQYTAKVSLSAGYFAYGDLFRNHVDTENLRKIMTKSHEELLETHSDMNVQAHYLYMEDETKEHKLFKHICTVVGGHSCVGIVPSNNYLTFFTGILGGYVGMIRVEADTREFPNEGDCWWGHFMCPQNGRLGRVSFHRLMEKLIGIKN